MSGRVSSFKSKGHPQNKAPHAKPNRSRQQTTAAKRRTANAKAVKEARRARHAAYYGGDKE